jgi:hypothetical protein
MAIIFTDAQLRELTGQLINADDKIAGIQKAGEAANKLKQDYKDLDDQEKIYFDNWVNIIDQFHTELKLLNSSQRTLYNSANVDPSARLSPGNVHFTDWAGYKPKIISSNNGNPVSTYSGHYEIDRINRIVEWTGKIKTGFTGAAVSGTGTSYSSAGSFQVGSAVTAVSGQPIVLFQANAAVYGICTGSSTVSNPGPPPTSSTTITLNVLETYGTLSGSFSFAQNSSGFTNAVRITTNNDGFLLMCKQILTDTSNNLLAVVNQELSALNSNDSKADSNQINSAKTTTESFKATVNNWINLVDVPTSNQLKFGDTQINAYNTSLISRRDTYIPSRVLQITNSLGSVSQPNTQDVTGNGRYHDLFISLNIRIHKISGHLRNFYQMDLAVVASQEQASVKLSEATRNKDYAIVKLFVEEPTGTSRILVKDVSRLAIGNAVKIMDNAVEGVLDFTIIDIQAPNIVILSNVVPPKYTLSNQARLVRIL